MYMTGVHLPITSQGHAEVFVSLLIILYMLSVVALDFLDFSTLLHLINFLLSLKNMRPSFVNASYLAVFSCNSESLG